MLPGELLYLRHRSTRRPALHGKNPRLVQGLLAGMLQDGLIIGFAPSSAS